jgi:hypothetical protein
MDAGIPSTSFPLLVLNPPAEILVEHHVDVVASGRRLLFNAVREHLQRVGVGRVRDGMGRAPDPKLAPLAVSRPDECDQLRLVGGVVESVRGRHHRTDLSSDTQRGATPAMRQPQGTCELPVAGPCGPASCWR